MSHWENWGGIFGRVHINTGEYDHFTFSESRREKKSRKRLEKLMNRRVQLGPALMGWWRIQKALEQGRSHAKSK